MALRRKPPAAAAPTGRGGPSATGKGGRPAQPAQAAPKVKRTKQLRMVFALARQRDPKLPLVLLGWFLLPVAIGVLLGLLVGPLVFWIILGILVGVFVALNVFGRRVQRTAYAELEGKPGAAASVVDRMRGDWRVTPAVQVNRAQDVVSRVVCRAGVVLLAEGRGRGPRDLLAAEVRRVRRVVGDVPVHDIVVGNGEGEVPLTRLQSTLMRKPRVLKRPQVDQVDKRLRALGAANPPIPKGPIPRSVPRGGKVR